MIIAQSTTQSPYNYPFSIKDITLNKASHKRKQPKRREIYQKRPFNQTLGSLAYQAYGNYTRKPKTTGNKLEHIPVSNTETENVSLDNPLDSLKMVYSINDDNTDTYDKLFDEISNEDKDIDLFDLESGELSVVHSGRVGDEASINET